jgi:hypothetical protein
MKNRLRERFYVASAGAETGPMAIYQAGSGRGGASGLQDRQHLFLGRHSKCTHHQGRRLPRFFAPGFLLWPQIA